MTMKALLLAQSQGNRLSKMSCSMHWEWGPNTRLGFVVCYVTVHTWSRLWRFDSVCNPFWVLVCRFGCLHTVWWWRLVSPDVGWWGLQVPVSFLLVSWFHWRRAFDFCLVSTGCSLCCLRVPMTCLPWSFLTTLAWFYWFSGSSYPQRCHQSI